MKKYAKYLAKASVEVVLFLIQIVVKYIERKSPFLPFCQALLSRFFKVNATYINGLTNIK